MTIPRILCVAYGGGHIRACLPVLAKLRRRAWKVDLLALTTAYDLAASAGFHPWRVRDLLLPDDEAMLARGVELAAAFRSSQVVPQSETEAYLAFGYKGLVLLHGEEEAAQLYRREGRAAFDHALLAERVLDRARPDVVLATNSPRAERATIIEAQRRGIPAFVLNDLVASRSNYWLHDPAYADRVFVISEPVRQRLIESGHDQDKIMVTGNPALSPMIGLRHRRLGRKPTARLSVLYISQPLPPQDSEHLADMRRTLGRLARLRPEWEIFVRLHPNEAADADWIMPPLRHRAGATLDEDLYQADVVITHGSTAGLEAGIAGIPLVQQLGSTVAREVPYGEMGLAYVSNDLGDLDGAIEAALAKGPCAQIQTPENPAALIANIIEEEHGKRSKARPAGTL